MTPGNAPWARASSEEFVATDLGSVNVRVGGRENGRVMVFWPSLLMNGAMWRHQFEHYAPRYRIVLIDPPGIGRSARLSRIVTLQQCSLCLLQVLDALGIDECVLVGNSWGAILGGVFAADHPERLSGVVAANGTASAATLLDKVTLTPLIAFLGLHTRTPRWFAAVTRSTFEGKTASTNNPEFTTSVLSVLDEDPKSMSHQMRSILLKRNDIEDLLRSIRNVPVLVIAGEEDRQFSVATVRDVAAAIPDSRFIVLPMTGHLSPLENPQQFNAAVDAFLREIGQGSD